MSPFALTKPPFSIHLAQFISVSGHPLLTVPLSALVLLCRYESAERAGWLSVLLIGGLFVPLGVVMYRRQATGLYTNFDVSDRGQRQGWYWLVLGLLAGVTLVTYLTKQTYLLRLSLSLATLLLITAQGLNRFIKSSLHVSLNTYLAYLLMLFSLKIGLSWLLFVPLIGWSRVQLGRHTMTELLMGGFLGSAFGGLLIYLAY